jgi:hypothetical protein
MVNLNAIMQMFDEGESGGLACVVRRAWLCIWHIIARDERILLSGMLCSFVR